jgi:lipopolysaccharide transport system ATP-binding protein
MAQPAIRAEGISKAYRIGTWRARYATLGDTVVNTVRRGGRRTQAEPDGNTIWALDDVSFEIEPGQALGFVGRNGAGKSTLLKILSRITKPTRGVAEIRGRVGSLLEVGTGFHGELTGRENVFLNGSLLGLRKGEIDRRLDEIVAFSEMERFIDTPVKRYSTGMTVRLAFAVAAHLEPEILLVDEVLAVGDVAFQRKCLGKMGEVASEGRTVLFVSHNMSVIQALCRRGIFLAEGRIEADGTVTEAVDAYLASLEQTAGADLLERSDRQGWQEVRVKAIEIDGRDGSPSLSVGEAARFTFHLTDVLPGLTCSFTIFDHLGQPVTTLSSAQEAPDDEREADSNKRAECVIDELTLVPGRYRVDVVVRAGGHTQDRIEGAAFFDVEEGLVRGRPFSRDDVAGNVFLPQRWRLPVA